MKNLIAFFEIPVTYFYQSVNFYQTILGVELMVAEYNNEKMACFVQDGQTVGTISYAPNFKPSEHGVLIHFNCEDIDRSIRQVMKQGGSIVIPRLKFKPMGNGILPYLLTLRAITFHRWVTICVTNQLSYHLEINISIKQSFNHGTNK